MKFHNPTDATQKTQIGETLYTIPPKATVEIPDHMAYVVKARGMVLKTGPGPEGSPKAETREALPSEVERLLGSRFISARQREDFSASWSRAGRTERARMFQGLQRIAEGRSPEDRDGDFERDPDVMGVGGADDAPGAAEQAGDEAAVGDQLTEAATAAGRPRNGRRAAGG